MTSSFTLEEGQSVTFVLRPGKEEVGHKGEETQDKKTLAKQKQKERQKEPVLDQEFVDRLLSETTAYWVDWIGQCTYKGRWREFVQRSALVLKVSSQLFFFTARFRSNSLIPKPKIASHVCSYWCYCCRCDFFAPRGFAWSRQELGLPLLVAP